MAKLSGRRIAELASEVYDDDLTYQLNDPRCLPWLVPKLEEFLAFVAALEPDKIYALVTAELY